MVIRHYFMAGNDEPQTNQLDDQAGSEPKGQNFINL